MALHRAARAAVRSSSPAFLAHVLLQLALVAGCAPAGDRAAAPLGERRLVDGGAEVPGRGAARLLVGLAPPPKTSSRA